MTYLVDRGRLLYVKASSPADAAQLGVLALPGCPPVLIVHEPKSGYRFPFLYNKTDGENDEAQGTTDTSRL